eukprot:TRINITY_DN11627_c0_g1_i1.p1 TRINITY_DN11627_c0_g1~~TRINITY_DN11627_c0_g1_i1.p1  ORF type:complete len:447 (-),score=108.22 TRINITY_DN11627_c0_g1_i1:212-1510(-)
MASLSTRISLRSRLDEFLLSNPDSSVRSSLWRFPSLTGSPGENSTVQLSASTSVPMSSAACQRTVSLGSTLTPDYDTRREEIALRYLSGPLVDEVRQLAPPSDAVRWLSASDAVCSFEDCTLPLEPETLTVLRRLQSHAAASDEATFIAECQRRALDTSLQLDTCPELSPGIFCVPIRSKTLAPFTHTNLYVIRAADEALIVDPGASAEGSADFEAVLRQLPATLRVFVTHHHHDHWDGLHLVEKTHPSATVLGHPDTLRRIETTLRRVPVLGDGSPESTISVGSTRLRAINTPGHTDGHLVLFDDRTRALLAGDHVVGYGSATLDFDCGDMSDYFDSTRYLIALNPRVALPAHGPPSYDPIALLNQYIAHRTDREQRILKCYEAGNHTLDSIVQVVYSDVPQQLWPYAKSNILLHLRKLEKDGRIRLQASL